jgi:YHS domain-containing protein
MKLSKILLVARAVLPLTTGALAADQPQTQTVCPVLGGNIDQNVYVDYQGKRIYFCCQGCDAEFKKDPEKYTKKIQDQGITLEKSPEAQK